MKNKFITIATVGFLALGLSSCAENNNAVKNDGSSSMKSGKHGCPGKKDKTKCAGKKGKAKCSGKKDKSKCSGK